MSCVACKQAYSSAMTLGRVLKTAASTGHVWNQALKDARLATCQKCSEYQANPPKCKVCGCYLSVKAGLIAAACDKGKWTA